MENFFNLENLTIQTFDDIKERQQRDLAQIFPYSQIRIEYLSNKGAGIFFVPNRQENPWQRSIENTICFEFLSADFDIGKEKQTLAKDELEIKKTELLNKLKSLEITPNLIIVTKNGLQPIWQFSNLMQLQTVEKRYEINEYYKSLLSGFAVKTGLVSEGDNLARVIRFPETQHQKNPNDKFLIQLIKLNATKITVEKFAQTYPPTQAALKRPVSNILHSGSDDGSRNMDVASVIGSLFAHYDKDDWLKICFPLIQAFNAHFVRPPLTANILERTFNSIAKTVIKKDPFAKYRKTNQQDQNNKQVNSSQSHATDLPATPRKIEPTKLEITFSEEYEQKLIAREQSLLKQLQGMKTTNPEYQSAHKEWFRLRIKGEELGLFESVIPIENEPWKMKR